MTHFSNAQFWAAFILGTAGGTATFFHAERNKIPHPSAWASFVFFVLLVGGPTYLWYVRRIRKRRAGA